MSWRSDATDSEESERGGVLSDRSFPCSFTVVHVVLLPHAFEVLPSDRGMLLQGCFPEDAGDDDDDACCFGDDAFDNIDEL